MKFSKLVSYVENIQEELIKNKEAVNTELFGPLLAINAAYNVRYSADTTDNEICGKMNALAWRCGMATPITIGLIFRDASLVIEGSAGDNLSARLEAKTEFFGKYQRYGVTIPWRGIDIESIDLKDVIVSPQVLTYFIDHSEIISDAIKTVVPVFPEKLEDTN